MSKPVDRNSNPAPHTQLASYGFQDLPDELLLEIFSYLIPRYPRALAALSLVSLRFQVLTSGDALWRPIFVHLHGAKVEEGVAELQKKYPISWQALCCRFHALPTFVLDTQVHRTNITLEAQGLRGHHPAVGAVVGGVYNLFAATDGRYVRKGYIEEALAAPEGQVLTHLSHDGEHLYALSKAGLIFQWNPEEEGDLPKAPMKTIEVALSNDKVLRFSKKDKPNNDCTPKVRQFLSREGFIVILYHVYKHHVLEIVEIESNRQQLLWIEGGIFNNSNPDNVLFIKDGKLFMNRSTSYSIFDLKTGQEQSIDLKKYASAGRQWCVSGFSGNSVFYSGLSSQEPEWPALSLLNLQDGAPLRQIEHYGFKKSKSQGFVLGDLFFRADFDLHGVLLDERTFSVKIIVVDLRSGKKIGEADFLDKDRLLIDLITICLKNQHSLETESTLSQNLIQQVSYFFGYLMQSYSDEIKEEIFRR